MTDSLAFTVRGMTCDGCARSVRAVLASVPGVAAVESVDVAGPVVVRTSGPVDREALADALDEAGYDAEFAA